MWKKVKIILWNGKNFEETINEFLEEEVLELFDIKYWQETKESFATVLIIYE